MITGLVVAGHNVTVVSPGTDMSSENFHHIYMEKVYDKVHNECEEGLTTDAFELEDISPFTRFLSSDDWKGNSCKCQGFVESDGWKLLKSYPNDFKVFFLIFSECALFEFESLFPFA